MKTNKERIERAQEIALDYLEYIIDYHETPDFIEVIGNTGGDVITYRVYDDGAVYEK